MQHKLIQLPKMKLIGKQMRMSLAENRTFELWKSFMAERDKICNRVNSDYISMQVYDPALDFKDFNPNTVFEKWAAVEVVDFDEVPAGMETYTLPGGLYAVFIHRGTPADFRKTFDFIFREWLPASEFETDRREHFERLGDKYINNHPDSEEEVWVPVRKKT